MSYLRIEVACNFPILLATVLIPRALSPFVFLLKNPGHWININWRIYMTYICTYNRFYLRLAISPSLLHLGSEQFSVLWSRWWLDFVAFSSLLVLVLFWSLIRQFPYRTHLQNIKRFNYITSRSKKDELIFTCFTKVNWFSFVQVWRQISKW